MLALGMHSVDDHDPLRFSFVHPPFYFLECQSSTHLPQLIYLRYNPSDPSSVSLLIFATSRAIICSSQCSAPTPS